MRMILGIILGILIVFNWSSVKALFDSSLASQSGGGDKAGATAPASGQPVPVMPSAQPQSLSESVEQRLKDAASNR